MCGGFASGHRHVDIGFLGTSTPRRELLFAKAAGLLWEWQTDLRFLNPRRLAEGDESSATADTNVLLSVHGGDETSFEWSGVVDAMANGCVILSETSSGFEPLVAGVHFVMAPYETLVEQAVALAFDEPRRSAIAEAARALATTELSRIDRPRVAAGQRRARRSRRRPVASPAFGRQGLPKLVSELKAAYLAQVDQTRSIEATISLLKHGDADHADIASTSTWPSFAAEVSVVIPLFNDGHHLADSVQSVIAAGGGSGPATELIIVDDHSTDGSRDVAERLLVEIDWFPATVVGRAANGGPAVARNVGFNVARASHVLALDAGNTLYPTALRRLFDTLVEASSDVVAAYGIAARFDTSGPLGLTGHLSWAVDVLVHGEFGDAPALFRREAWTEVGGYPTPAGGVEDAWDEYDLWLSVAERGLRAEHVRSIVGRAREVHGSVPSISDVDLVSTFITLRERHPRLPWPS